MVHRPLIVSSSCKNEHLFDSFKAMGNLTDPRLAAIQDQLIYKGIFLRLGLSLNAPWNEIVRAFRRFTLTLYEDKNTPEMLKKRRQRENGDIFSLIKRNKKIQERLVNDEDDGLAAAVLTTKLMASCPMIIMRIIPQRT